MVSPCSRSASKACIGCASSAITKFVISTMLLIGLRPIAVSRYCSHNGDGCTVTFSKTSALYRGQRSRSSICILTAAGPCGRRSSLAGSVSSSPRIAATSRAMPWWPHRSGRCVMLLLSISMTRIGHAAVERTEFDNAVVIAIDAEFRAARQHAVALDAVDHFLLERDVGREQARAAVGRAADHRLPAERAGIDHGLHVVAAGNRLHRFDARRARLGQQRARLLDPLALGGLHRDQPFQQAGGGRQAGDHFADPVVREFHG